MQSIGIVALAVALCVGYGIVHDQITARICVEYFTIGHPPVFPTENPTLLGIGWGIIATWWVGMLLGIPLAIAARFGAAPKRTAGQLVRPMLILLMCCAGFASIMGVAGFLAATTGAVYLSGDLADLVPPDRHVPFLTDLWAHSASYFAGIIGGIVLILNTWRIRNRNLVQESKEVSRVP